MTAEDRNFRRQARLVSHYLELFRQVQDMRFDDPQPLIQSLFDLIDQTVSLYLISPAHTKRFKSFI